MTTRDFQARYRSDVARAAAARAHETSGLSGAGERTDA